MRLKTGHAHPHLCKNQGEPLRLFLVCGRKPEHLNRFQLNMENVLTSPRTTMVTFEPRHKIMIVINCFVKWRLCCCDINCFKDQQNITIPVKVKPHEEFVVKSHPTAFTNTPHKYILVMLSYYYRMESEVMEQDRFSARCQEVNCLLCFIFTDRQQLHLCAHTGCTFW